MFIGEAVLVVAVMLETKGLTRSVLASAKQADRMAEMIAKSNSPETPLFVADEEIKQKIASQKPYREWLDKNLIKLADIADAPAAAVVFDDGAPVFQKFESVDEALVEFDAVFLVFLFPLWDNIW